MASLVNLTARLPSVVTSAFVLLAISTLPGHTQEGLAGIVTPTALPVFNPDAPACSKPSGLDRSLVFLQDNERDFMRGVGEGLAAAARDRGLEYRVALAGNDAALMRRQGEEEVARKTGAAVISPVDPRSMGPVTKQFLWSGAYVGAVVPPS